MKNPHPKPAVTSVPILYTIASRWSPRAFASDPVEREKLVALLETARWAPSSMNRQPWRFVLATGAEPEEHGWLAERWEQALGAPGPGSAVDRR